jgi:hypothetical protein
VLLLSAKMTPASAAEELQPVAGQSLHVLELGSGQRLLLLLLLLLLLRLKQLLAAVCPGASRLSLVKWMLDPAAAAARQGGAGRHVVCLQKASVTGSEPCHCS